MRDPCHRCPEEAEAGIVECRYCGRDLADLIRGSGIELAAFATSSTEKMRLRAPCHRCLEEAEAGILECRYCARDLADLLGSWTEGAVLAHGSIRSV